MEGFATLRKSLKKIGEALALEHTRMSLSELLELVESLYPSSQGHTFRHDCEYYPNMKYLKTLEHVTDILCIDTIVPLGGYIFEVWLEAFSPYGISR